MEREILDPYGEENWNDEEPVEKQNYKSPGIFIKEFDLSDLFFILDED